MVQEVLLRRPGPWGWGAQWPATRSGQRPRSWSFYNYTRSCQTTQRQSLYGCLVFEANRKDEKKSGCLMSWPQIKNNPPLWGVFFSYSTQKQRTISQSDWKSGILYKNQKWPAQWLDWEAAPKHFPKPNLHSQKSHGHCFMVCCPSNPLQLSETITSGKYAHQINEMHQKLQCLQPALVNRKGAILLQDNAWPHLTQPTLQKLNELGYKVLPHPPYPPDLSPTDYHFFKHLNNFLQGKHFHNQ